MRLNVNGTFIEGDNYAAVIGGAINTFATVDGDDLIPPDLSTVQVWAIDYCQQWRGNQRAKIGLSAAQWQDLAYAGKAAHCRAWLADRSQKFGMGREAKVRGLSNVRMAKLIVAQNDAWLDTNDQIDSAYAQVKSLVENAKSIDDITAALLVLQW